MNSFYLKIIAIILMLIDHLSVILPQEIGMICKIIGRLAFPIFAFLLVEGYFYTKNIKKYISRLVIFGAISQIPYIFYFHNGYLNIFFTLATGLVTMYISDYKFHNKKDTNTEIQVILIVGIMILAEILHIEYGIYGIMTILIFKLLKDDFKGIVRGQALINGVYCLMAFITSVNWLVLSQGLAVLALPIIKKYNNEKGKSLKYFFYVFYPLHITILYFIKILIN